MSGFYNYISDIAFTLDKLGVEPIFFIAIGVFILAWLAALDIRRTESSEQKLRDEIEELKAKLSAEPTLAHDAPLLDEGKALKKKEKLPESSDLSSSPSSTSAPSKNTVFSGLSKTRGHFFGRLREILKGRDGLGADQYEALEELLITSDLGVGTSTRLLEQLQERNSEGDELSEDALRSELQGFVLDILKDDVSQIVPQKRGADPLVVLVVGVNGVGKTTTIGKLAQHFQQSEAFSKSKGRILLGACDTFRAAAVEQLQAWGERVGVDVWAGEPEAKPSTVAYQAVHKAKDEGYDVLIVDTAGRLHTRVNLMNELENVVQIISRELPGAPHETLLVLDATTGQNALQQAKEFNQRAALSGLVVTKLDGTPKGGIVVAIKDELGVPIRYIGVGEGAADLKVFDAGEFVEAMFAEAGVG